MALDRVFLFSYYGSKSKVARKYPPPLHDIIIEPFAGAANYSCLYYQHQVILYEIDPIIFGVLDFLIYSSPNDILALPLIKPEDDVRDLSICQEAKDLIGFSLGDGTTGRRYRMSPRSIHRTKKKAGTWDKQTRFRLSCMVKRIKHWKLYNESCWASFDNFRNKKQVTWFIDPPYQGIQGAKYRFGSRKLDYDLLGKECRGLEGQVIVCEGENGNWLPFRKHYINGSTLFHRKWEMVWTNRCLERMGFGL